MTNATMSSPPSTTPTAPSSSTLLCVQISTIAPWRHTRSNQLCECTSKLCYCGSSHSCLLRKYRWVEHHLNTSATPSVLPALSPTTSTNSVASTAQSVIQLHQVRRITHLVHHIVTHTLLFTLVRYRSSLSTTIWDNFVDISILFRQQLRDSKQPQRPQLQLRLWWQRSQVPHHWVHVKTKVQHCSWCKLASGFWSQFYWSRRLNSCGYRQCCTEEYSEVKQEHALKAQG